MENFRADVLPRNTVRVAVYHVESCVTHRTDEYKKTLFTEEMAPESQLDGSRVSCDPFLQMIATEIKVRVE